jgi:5-methylthioadenosine/S-adenosylhomocysteine deaminase
MPKVYTARYILPIVASPIENGAIVVDGPQIVRVGPRDEVLASFAGSPHEDFGNAAILPGLINAHSHLELTVMRGFLEREEHDFFAWLRKLTIARLKMTDEDLFVSATCGAIEAARAGITCLGDSSSFGLQSMRAVTEVGLRAIVYQESFGPDPNVAAESVEKLQAQIAGMREIETNLVRAGVSPHAPYTVSGPQLEMISRLALKEALPLMMHAAESQAEKQLLLDGTGPFAEGLRVRGIDWRAPGVSTVRYLEDHGILETRPLLAHCINVDDEDLEIVKRAGAGIAHCPKSNAKLRHGRAPFTRFIAHEIKTGLGSDSVGSNNLCDILEEARFATLLMRTSGSDSSLSNAAESQTEVGAADALFAATLGGAQALGLDDQIGALREGMQADIAVVNLGNSHQQPLRSAPEALIFSSSGRDVLLTLVAGKEVYCASRITTIDEKAFTIKLEQLGKELDRD